MAEKFADIRRRAAQQGRQVRLGVRLHVIVRETNEEAWADAERLISKLTDEDIARAQAGYARMDSVGQSRMAALHGGRRDRLEVAPNLWAGVGLVRGGAGTALVGDAATVAERLREYAALGADSFVLSGYPHLEESIRFAELVFPCSASRPSPPATRPRPAAPSTSAASSAGSLHREPPRACALSDRKTPQAARPLKPPDV